MTAHRPPDDRFIDVTIGRASDDSADRVHLLLAGAQLFSLPLATTPSAWCFALLMICVVVRLPHNWRSYEPLFQRWLPWTMLAAGAWIALSIAWSSDPAQGFDEIGAWRMGLLVVALWPVRDRAAWLVGAALLGVAAQNANQLLQVAGWIDLRPDESNVGRYGGWLHPIQTGTWCGAALCWHTAAILTTRSRWWPFLIGAAAAGLGLLLTGSRGPWLATAIVLPVLVLAVALLHPATRMRAVVLVGLFAVAIAATSAIPDARTYVRERVAAAAAEYRAALDEERYLSDVGMRLGLARWALEIGRESPIVGSGAGSYGDALEALPSHQDWRETSPRTRRERNQVARTFPADHAHNSILHIFATSGLVGVAFCLLVLGVIVLGALRNFRTIPFGAATPFVVVAWFIGSQFDTFHLSGQLCGLLCLCAFLSVAGPLPAVPPE